ncbi:hypothetical protein [Nannocystis sp.]|uniref:hypothetical protein n=1 Tax=Nannocystis sp. TaxID=1962667 RepID=UPI0025F515F8|nr:hypothetical protein [Nannocystis sp.]MBK7823789.1 hypothetical protein [Nannocystis sp.]
MGLPVPRAISLGEELSSLTRDDRARLDQILWILGNDLRRDPSDLLSHAVMAMAHTLAGEVTEFRRCLAQISPHVAQFPDWLKLNVLSFHVIAGESGLASSLIEAMLPRDDLAPKDRARLLRLAGDAALRFGDLALLARLADLMPAGSESRGFLHALRETGLDHWWHAQQQAIEAVLGPHTTRFGRELQWSDADRPVIVLDYLTDAASFAELDVLQARVDDAMERTYATHPEGPAATLGVVVIAVHLPFIPRPEVLRDHAD